VVVVGAEVVVGGVLTGAVFVAPVALVDVTGVVLRVEVTALVGGAALAVEVTVFVTAEVSPAGDDGIPSADA